jgi:antitoxin YobK
MNDCTSLAAEIAGLILPRDGTSPTFLGPVADWKIVRAELALGAKLPASFRCFLNRFGGGFVFGCEILGVVEEPGHWLDIVHVNRLGPRYIPHTYVRFVITPGDGAYYLATVQRGPSGECPVVCFDHGEVSVTIADSFLDFLSKARDGLVRPAPFPAIPAALRKVAE